MGMSLEGHYSDHHGPLLLFCSTGEILCKNGCYSCELQLRKGPHLIPGVPSCQGCQIASSVAVSVFGFDLQTRGQATQSHAPSPSLEARGGHSGETHLALVHRCGSCEGCGPQAGTDCVSVGVLRVERNMTSISAGLLAWSSVCPVDGEWGSEPSRTRR